MSATANASSVYAILLDDAVLKNRRFAEANPGYCHRRPCVYVGRTGVTPDARFRQHREGYKCCNLVRRHGRRLMPELYESLNPMTYDESVKMEIQLALRLREQGYAVWQK